MGCRTRANEYYSSAVRESVQQNTRPHLSVEGTAVRKAAPVQPAPVRIKKRKKVQTTASQMKALKRQKGRFIALGVTAAVVIFLMAGAALKLTDMNETLSNEISKKESALADLNVYNEAKEYEINSSVDLNYVIQVATENLGMVRSNPSQVVTYSVKNSEYLLQVAAVPTE